MIALGGVLALAGRLFRKRQQRRRVEEAFE
jgi:hypothetical protein